MASREPLNFALLPVSTPRTVYIPPTVAVAVGVRFPDEHRNPIDGLGRASSCSRTTCEAHPAPVVAVGRHARNDTRQLPPHTRPA
jgi:hypothetical protein